MRKVFIKGIDLYIAAISPWLGHRCRYVPSCSEYAKQAIGELGVVKGSYLAIRRLMKCHPWGGSGYDPVPKPKEDKSKI